MGIITEVMMGVVPGLTPAQVGFLESSISGFSLAGWKVELAGQAASTRKFYRVSGGGKRYVLVVWDSGDEDWPRFLEIGAYAPLGGFLPKIYASDPAHGLILEEDLGAATLKRFSIDNFGNPGEVEKKYREVIDTLRLWGRADVSGCPAIASRAMDAETFLWESGYFARHCVTEFFGKGDLLTEAWEGERLRMAESAAGAARANMHRDFQSENILIHDGRVRFVDFQGARLGPAHYDAASLLFDPYAALDYGAIERLLGYYFDRVGDSDGFYVCAAQRLVQALGAYANLSLNRGKPNYRQFIPPALERLSYVLKSLPDYPALSSITYIIGKQTT